VEFRISYGTWTLGNIQRTMIGVPRRRDFRVTEPFLHFSDVGGIVIEALVAAVARKAWAPISKPRKSAMPRYTGSPMDLDNMRSLGLTKVDVYCGRGHEVLAIPYPEGNAKIEGARMTPTTVFALMFWLQSSQGLTGVIPGFPVSALVMRKIQAFPTREACEEVEDALDPEPHYRYDSKGHPTVLQLGWQCTEIDKRLMPKV
jgi:hypothetical protein